MRDAGPNIHSKLRMRATACFHSQGKLRIFASKQATHYHSTLYLTIAARASQCLHTPPNGFMRLTMSAHASQWLHAPHNVCTRLPMAPRAS
jgi:hypothetical protein